MPKTDSNFLNDAFTQITKRDIVATLQKDAHYESSWKARGGVGAFFTIVRPWDRLEAIAKRNGYDLLKVLDEEKAAGKNGEDGTLLACIRDVRCYLMLLEAELMNRSQSYPHAPLPRERVKLMEPVKTSPPVEDCQKAMETLSSCSPKLEKVDQAIGVLIQLVNSVYPGTY